MFGVSTYTIGLVLKHHVIAALDVNANWERYLSAGRIPPVAATMLRIDEWYRSNDPAI
jgi:hypothetical protein